MHQHLARIFFVAILLALIVGCSNGGSPTTPNLADNSSQDPSALNESDNDLTPSIDLTDIEERVLGNFYYYSKQQDLLAWGTVYVNQDGWDYRVDYLAPRLRALLRSDVKRKGQEVIDLTYLNLISCAVSYTDKPTPIPPELPTYTPGEFMNYRLDLVNNFDHAFPGQNVAAVQVDMFDNPLGPDARDEWLNVDIPLTGQTLFGDWTVEPGLADGIYYTRVRVWFEFWGGYFTIVIFDSKVGTFAVDENGGPDKIDPVAKGVTTTPVLAIGETAHVQDNGSFDPDGGPIELYEWDWENDGIFDDTGSSADHIYSVPGVYYVNLRVTDNEGDTDDLTDDPGDELIEITVTPPPVPPVAVGVADSNSVYVNQDVGFDGTQSYDPDGGDIVLYEWDWENDGVFDSLGATATHSWPAPGVYYVQLRVTDDELQTDILDEPIEITVDELPGPPTACFTFTPEDPDVCITIEFDASCSSSAGFDLVLYEWDWENDGSFDASSTTPLAEHAFETVGEHTVKLRVTDSYGQAGVTENTVEVANILPTAMAWSNKTNVDTGETVNFYAYYSHDNDCNNQEIVLYEWDFDGDGEFDFDSTDPTAEHAYDTPGVYEVQLRVTDDEGGTDELDEPLSITVTLNFMDPIAIAGQSASEGIPCYSITFFDDGSYDPDGGSIELYEWDFDADGNYDETGPEVTHTFNDPGEFPIQLRVTDDEGATDTLDEPLLVSIINALPTASAFAADTELTLGDPLLIDGTSSHDNDCENQSIVNYEWDFLGDGNFVEGNSFMQYTYDEPGIYNVQLRVTDDEGGTDLLDEPIVVTVSMEFMDPIAYATASTFETTVCSSILFSDDGSYDPDGGTIDLYEWDFDGDGTFDETGPEVWQNYDTPGTYEVQLQVTDDEGATDQLDEPLFIEILNALPTASASASKYQVIPGELISFDGSSSHDNDCNGQSIVEWLWDWENDGTFDDTGSFAVHWYPEPGIYFVQLQVQDDEGGYDTLDEPLMIEVVTEQTDPVAVADIYPDPQYICNEVTLDGSSSYDPDGGIIVNWEWDLDNDGSYEYTGETFPFSAILPGTYTFNLRVTDDEGATDTLDTPVTVEFLNHAPVADGFASDNNVFVNDVITFDGTASFDVDTGCGQDGIVLYEWDWTNDGVFDETGSIQTHSYDSPGIYEVQLRVTDSFGETDILDTPIEITVSVEYQDPIALADASPNPQTVCADVNLFDDGSYDPDGGTIDLYEWDIGNDGTYEYTGSSIFYSWNAPGTYYVNLRVTDDEGATDTLDSPLEIIVENALPTAVAEANKYNVFENEQIDFDGSGSHDNDCDGSIDLYEWDWENDGIFDDSGVNASHSYPTAGTYYVNLRVTDDEGETDDLDTPLEITVNAQPLDPVAVADATPNPQVVCADVEFDGTGSYDPDGGSITSYEWDWDNDGVFDENNPSGVTTHSWDSVGTYYVDLRVTDDEGATDTLDTPLEIVIENALPTAVATASTTNPTICVDITFDGTGSHDNDCDGSITKWEWDWDNNGIWDEVGDIVTHSFDTPGVYYVNLRVTDDEGDTDTLDIPLEITADNALPTADGEADRTNVFTGELINFNGSASHDNDCDGDIVLWQWDWENDGTFDDTGEFASHSYPDPGTYYVNLRVTDDEGATDDIDTPIQIDVNVEMMDPVAYATAGPNPQTVCEDVTLSDDGSYDPDGGLIVKWEWDVDNDGTWDFEGDSIQYSWDTPGLYLVNMRVTDDEGATDTIDELLQIVIENALPTAVGSVDTNTGDITYEFQFDGSASHDNDCTGDIIKWEWDFDYDGVNFDIDASGVNAGHIYPIPGVYDVQLRVTDDENGQDMLDTPIQITVTAGGECLNGIHEYKYAPDSLRGLSNHYSSIAFSVLPRADIAYIESGSMGGLGIVQGGPNSLVTFDPDVDADDPIDDSVFKKPTGGSGDFVLTTVIDSAPYDNMVAVVTSDKPNQLRLLDSSVIAGNFFPWSRDWAQGEKIMAVDFASNGDIFVVTSDDVTITLYKGIYIGGPDFYDEAGWTSFPISIFVGMETDIFDIAVNWSNNQVYVFDAGTNALGRINVFDGTTLALTTTVNDLFPSPIFYEFNVAAGVAGYADIEIDHVDGNDGCHMFLYARLSESDAEVRKYDENINMIDSAIYTGLPWPSMTINPNTLIQDRDLTAPGMGNLAFWHADNYQ